jgi:hypothetical protein
MLKTTFRNLILHLPFDKYHGADSSLFCVLQFLVASISVDNGIFYNK